MIPVYEFRWLFISFEQFTLRYTEVSVAGPNRDRVEDAK